ELDQVQTRRQMQLAHVVGELQDLNGSHGDRGRAPHEVVETGPQQPAETLVDHLERRHPSANDAGVMTEVVVARFIRSGWCLSRHVTVVDAIDQRVDFVLREYVLTR